MVFITACESLRSATMSHYTYVLYPGIFEMEVFVSVFTVFREIMDYWAAIYPPFSLAEV